MNSLKRTFNDTVTVVEKKIGISNTLLYERL